MQRFEARSIDGAFPGWPRRPSLRAASALFFGASAGLTLITLFQRFLSRAFPRLDGAALGWTASAVFEIGCILLPFLLYVARHPGVASGMRLRAPSVSSALLAVLSAVVGVLFAGNFGTLWLVLLEEVGLTLSQSGAALYGDGVTRTMQVLLLCVMPGVCEELLFRGVVLGAWERRGTRYGILISALLFTALHGSVEGLPVQLVAGLALGFVVVASDSLYTGMIYHTTHNAFLLLLSNLSPGGQNAALGTGARLIEYLGGASGVLLTALGALLLGAVYAMLLAALRYMGANRNREFDRIKRGDRRPMDICALWMLMAGIVTAVVSYAVNLFTLLGVL